MPSRVSEERHQRNIERVRALVDAGSQGIVRDGVVGRTISGARRKYPLPCIGHRSGGLVITGYIRGARGGVSALIVKCDCGQPEYMVDTPNFRAFRSTRCPTCGRREGHKKRYWKYASVLADEKHRTRLLNRLSSAISRCHVKTNRAYAAYGGRGIRVYGEWRYDRAKFLQYAQTIPGWDDPALELDRADNNRGYEPGNIRFVSRTANRANRRTVRILQTELDDLRHRLRRAEEQIHSCDICRATYCP